MTPAQGLVAVLVAVACGAVWQVQDWRVGKKLAEQAGLHRDDLAAITNAAASQARAEQDKRLATELALATADQKHTKELSDAQRNQARLRDQLLLLACGCQSLSTQRIQPVAATCLPPPEPSAWFMQPVEPNLTQRMRNELSPSPTMGITD